MLRQPPKSPVNIFKPVTTHIITYIIEHSGLGWSDQGCHVKSMDNAHTECSCSHLTHFAVLMQFDTKSGSDDDTIISEVLN